MPRKTKAWRPGDIFTIEQNDGVCSVGQVLTLTMINVVSCAFYDIRVPCSAPVGRLDLSSSHLIAALSVSREQLDFGVWRVVGHQDIALDANLWPNEEARSEKWVGLTFYDAVIVEDLLNAYNGLSPWDNWHDPEYLDKLLISPGRKPKHLIYKRKK